MPCLQRIRLTASTWLALAVLTAVLAPAAALSTTAKAGVTTASAAFGFRDTADGASCKFFDVALGTRWPEDTVPRIDARGLAGGDKAYDVQVLDASKPARVYRWDVLALVKAWATGKIPNEGLLIGPPGATSGGGADFYSREADDVGLRPSLRVVYPDGATDYLSPAADVHLDCSTYTGLGERKVLHIGPGSAGALRFDLSRLRKGKADEATKAELILVRVASTGVWSKGELGAYRLGSPWTQALPAPPVGLAAAYKGDRGIQADAGVLWADDFSSGQLQQGWKQFQMVRSKPAPPLAALGASGQVLNLPSLHSVIPRNEHLGLDLRYRFAQAAGQAGQQEAYMRYYLLVGPEWASSPDTGKLPGFAGTYNRVGWGGRGWDGLKGWSARGAFYKGVAKDHPAHGLLALGNYVYHSKSRNIYGEMFPWSASEGLALLAPNRWYCIEQHVRLNTPGKEDGVLQAWVDGQPVFSKTDFRFRDTLAVGIEDAWFDLYVGGQGTAKEDMNVHIAQVVVATRYIGPMVP